MASLDPADEASSKKVLGCDRSEEAESAAAGLAHGAPHQAERLPLSYTTSASSSTVSSSSSIDMVAVDLSQKRARDAEHRDSLGATKPKRRWQQRAAASASDAGGTYGSSSFNNSNSGNSNSGNGNSSNSGNSNGNSSNVGYGVAALDAAEEIRTPCQR